MRLPTSVSNTMRVNLGMLFIVLALFAVAPQTPASGAHAASPMPVCLASPDAGQLVDGIVTVDSKANVPPCP